MSRLFSGKISTCPGAGRIFLGIGESLDRGAKDMIFGDATSRSEGKM
jgi:hypothetical protein